MLILLNALCAGFHFAGGIALAHYHNSDFCWFVLMMAGVHLTIALLAVDEERRYKPFILEKDE